MVRSNIACLAMEEHSRREIEGGLVYVLKVHLSCEYVYACMCIMQGSASNCHTNDACVFP